MSRWRAGPGSEPQQSLAQARLGLAVETFEGGPEQRGQEAALGIRSGAGGGGGWFGALGARRASPVYARPDRPAWAPPAAAFGPVWSALYAAAILAGARMPGRASRRAMALHLTQLTLNAAWPAAFFGVRSKRAALLIILALDITLGAEVAELRRQDPIAAGLLVPYLGWTIFATALNIAASDPPVRDPAGPR